MSSCNCTPQPARTRDASAADEARHTRGGRQAGGTDQQQGDGKHGSWHMPMLLRLQRGMQRNAQQAIVMEAWMSKDENATRQLAHARCPACRQVGPCWCWHGKRRRQWLDVGFVCATQVQVATGAGAAQHVPAPPRTVSTTSAAPPPAPNCSTTAHLTQAATHATGPPQPTISIVMGVPTMVATMPRWSAFSCGSRVGGGGKYMG